MLQVPRAAPADSPPTSRKIGCATESGHLTAPSPFVAGRLVCGFLLFFLAPVWGTAHNVLLPQPQKIQYGAGQLPLAGLSIRFTSPPSPEDRFAAQYLSTALLRATHISIPLRARSMTGHAIVFDRTGPVDALPGPDDRPGPVSRESYSLRVTPQGAEIQARSSAGLFYAVQTLRQLVEVKDGKAILPEVQIRDWPSMAYRGFMMDTSHGPMPTEEEIKRQIDFLARWKANQYYFYFEANVEMKGYPLVRAGSRYSQDQIRRIVAYARQRHVDVVPTAELFGHLHDLFRLELYSDFSPNRYGGELNPVDPRVQALVKNWVGQLVTLFPSRWFHIGFDEPWQLETVGSQVAKVSPGKLYLDWLKTVAGLIREQGKRVLFWSDVVTNFEAFKSQPELLSQFPPGLIAAAWDYWPEHDYNVDLAPLVKIHMPFVVCSGIWAWGNIVPAFYRTFKNIDGFLAAGRKFGAIGLMNTGWTDDGQVIYRMSRPAMAYGAIAAWQATPIDRGRFLRDYCRQLYPTAAADEVAAGVEALAQSQDLFADVLGGPSKETMPFFWEEPLTLSHLKRAQLHEGELRRARILAEKAEKHLYRARQLSKTDLPFLNSLLLGARMLDDVGEKNLFAVEMVRLFNETEKDPSYREPLLRVGSRAHGLILDLMDDITELRESYRQAWLAEYTPFRLGTVLGRWDAEYQYWRVMQLRFNEEVRSAVQAGKPFPLLDSSSEVP